MHKSTVFLSLAAVAAVSGWVHAVRRGADREPAPTDAGAEHAQSAPSPAIEFAPLTARDDPAILRRELTARHDAQLAEAMTRSRLEFRRMLDAVVPVPYFGVDSEPVAGGLKLTHIYPDTGAERAGLAAGDIVLELGGVPTDSKTALARSVRSQRVGASIEVRFRRGNEEHVVATSLGARPEEDEDDVEQFPDLATPPPAPPAPITLAFDSAPLGATPVELLSVLGGHGRIGSWIVVASGSGRALRQDDGDATGIRFPMVVARDFAALDARVQVRFRYAGGRADRAAGVVLRYQDPGNYLVARANALEGDLRIFRVVNGDRRTLPGAIVKGATDDERWHTLEFSATGAELSAVLDGSVRVMAYDTLFQRGGAGLWTKSDSRTEFDDLKFEATK